MKLNTFDHIYTHTTIFFCCGSVQTECKGRSAAFIAKCSVKIENYYFVMESNDPNTDISTIQ